MATRPVQISMDTDLLQQIDADPEVQQRGRSAFIRDALRHDLRVRDRLAHDEAIERAYGSRSEAHFAEIEALVGGQAWPER